MSLDLGAIKERSRQLQAPCELGWIPGVRNDILDLIAEVEQLRKALGEISAARTRDHIDLKDIARKALDA